MNAQTNHPIPTALKQICDHIQMLAAEHAVPEPQLLAVSKYASVEAIQTAYAAGQRAFGESDSRIARTKMANLPKTIEWHFIGRLQSNKTRFIAEHFAWVHSLDRLHIAVRLNAQRPDHLPPLAVCVQVNLSGAPQKAGIDPRSLETLLAELSLLSRLSVRGLMTMTEPDQTDAEKQALFDRLRNYQQDMQQKGFLLDTLSMGMSDDYPLAIAAGATIVRIGGAIFSAD